MLYICAICVIQREVWRWYNYFLFFSVSMSAFKVKECIIVRLVRRPTKTRTCPNSFTPIYSNMYIICVCVWGGGGTVHLSCALYTVPTPDSQKVGKAFLFLFRKPVDYLQIKERP